MSTRLERVEQMLRRELAAILLEGGLRDPRLSNVGLLSITGIKVSPDLAHARVYVDVLGGSPGSPQIAALQAGAGHMQRLLGRRIHLKRTPKLVFLRDEAIEQGNRIEQILAELGASPGEPGDDG